MSKLIDNEKRLREEYDELAAKCKVMEQKLEEAHCEKEKLITKVNVLEDQIITQQSLLDNDKKCCIIQDCHHIQFYSQCFP